MGPKILFCDVLPLRHLQVLKVCIATQSILSEARTDYDRTNQSINSQPVDAFFNTKGVYGKLEDNCQEGQCIINFKRDLEDTRKYPYYNLIRVANNLIMIFHNLIQHTHKSYHIYT